VAAVERSMPSVLPAEVMPGVELLKVRNAGGLRIYTFQVSEEGAHYYFAVKTEEGWRAAGGKQSGRQVMSVGEAIRAVAEAINTIYREMGVERRVGDIQKRCVLHLPHKCRPRAIRPKAAVGV